MFKISLLTASLLISSWTMAQDPGGEQAAADAPDRKDVSQPTPDGKQAPPEDSGGVKTLSGISILGNEEAPKSLVIVPWKSSQIGDGIGVTDAMDDRARPVDKEVFMREVHYYELRASGGDGSSESR
jgi:hypothetical protein